MKERPDQAGSEKRSLDMEGSSKAEPSDNAQKKATIIGADTAMQMGLEFVVSVLGLGGAGFFADSWLGTSPLCMVAGLLVGAAAGFWMLVKQSQNPPTSG